MFKQVVHSILNDAERFICVRMHENTKSCRTNKQINKIKTEIRTQRKRQAIDSEWRDVNKTPIQSDNS